MAHKPPFIRLHSTGVWYTTWAGRSHYFSKDEAASVKAFQDPKGEHPGSLVRWAEWRASKERAREVKGSRRGIYVIDLVEQFLVSYVEDDRMDTARYYRNHLRRFLSIFGKLRVDELNMQGLHAFHSDLKRMEIPVNRQKKGGEVKRIDPQTVVHDIKAVKTLLQWGQDRELVPTLNLRAIKTAKVFGKAPVHLTREEVLNAIHLAEARDRDLATYMALNYLCMCRPSETVRLICRRGAFEPLRMLDGTVRERGIFRLDQSKTQRASPFPRMLLMSDEALQWFDSSRPRWTRLDSYSTLACDGYGRVQPKRLQKSAGFHLQLLGHRRGDIDAILAHRPSEIWRLYLAGELWLHWGLVSQLTLRSSG